MTGKYHVARHWWGEVLPLRRVIDEEALKSDNGMLSSKFELIADAREGLEAGQDISFAADRVKGKLTVPEIAAE